MVPSRLASKPARYDTRNNASGNTDFASTHSTTATVLPSVLVCWRLNHALSSFALLDMGLDFAQEVVAVFFDGVGHYLARAARAGDLTLS